MTMILRVLGIRWRGEARVDMRLIRVNQDKDRSNTLIPKQAAESQNLLKFNKFYQAEVDKRGLLQAEDTVQTEFFKGSP
jgi:hypothetical protein